MAAVETTTWIDEPVIGALVRTSSVGPDWSSTSSGVYLGVALDEEDGVPYHYFINGEINGTRQGCFGFAAAPETATTTDLTPTELITRAQEDPVVRVCWKDEGDFGFVTTMTRSDVDGPRRPRPFDPDRVRPTGSLAYAAALAKAHGCELEVS